jgi:hypothetical protein
MEHSTSHFTRSAFNGVLRFWDLSQVFNFDSTFRSASSFNGDISRWQVENAETMHAMFRAATAFNVDISEWDTTPVRNATRMFNSATFFSANLCFWDWNSEFVDAFGRSGCPEQSDPNLSIVPVSPPCFSCYQLAGFWYRQARY